MTELDPYMDVSIPPAREVSEASVKQHNGIVAVSFYFMCVYVCQFTLQGLTSGMEEEKGGQFLNRKVQVSRVGSLCSSDISLDSSVSSDLEVG